jgi:hypothetical protein
MDPERLGGLRHLADEELATRLGRQRRGLAEQARAPAGGDRELETIQEDADDHRIERMFASFGERRKRRLDMGTAAAAASRKPLDRGRMRS